MESDKCILQPKLLVILEFVSLIINQVEAMKCRRETGMKFHTTLERCHKIPTNIICLYLLL
jgi:hypothetical protein